jgi:hypothetical protein
MKKLDILVVLVFAFMPVLFGCGAGKTSTMFITKTNAGFEFSYAPPTIALDISRVEGVLAPQFENGKKLPVMASFKFQNTGAFAPHVGSAFATGDAAVTMAALYGDGTPDSLGWEGRAKKITGVGFPGDSTLKLDNKPEPGKRFEYQANDVRPVFFGTDTMVGLKIAWSGMTATFPDTAKFGYNRKEFALVPISMEVKTTKKDGKSEVKSTKKEGKSKVKTTEEEGTSYHMKMSSLLATADVAVDARGTPQLKSTYTQYFATGNAATLLALQQDVRRAMLARLDPHTEAFKRFGPKIEPEHKKILTRALSGVYDGLGDLGEGKLADPDPIAAGHVKRLDKLVFSDLDIPEGLIYYDYNKDKKTLNKNTAYGNFKKEKSLTFLKMIAYWSTLSDSIRSIRLAKEEIEADPDITITLKDTTEGTTVPLSDEEKDILAKQLVLQETAINELDPKIRTNSDIIGAYQYFESLISPK